MCINSEINSDHAFCFPSPGKPNPNEPYGSSTTASRSRVIQPAQKGSTCGYYALQILRNEQRIGKCPPESQQIKRKVEVMVSQHRKALTEIDKELAFRIDFAEDLTEAFEGSCTKENAQQFLAHQTDQLALEPKKKCIAALQDFLKQDLYHDFYTYANESYLQAQMAAHEQLLKKFGLSIEAIRYIPMHFKQTWETMTSREKEKHERNLTFTYSASAYGCRHSPWHPDQPIASLIEQLKQLGPQLINGQIGRQFYEDPPFQLNQTIEGRSIFGWKPNSKRKEIKFFHAVVIIGAQIKDRKNLVYFIDPVDGSDPNDISTQKIYAISYDRLRSIITDMDGNRWKNENGEEVFASQKKYANQYALYMEAATEKQV